jgi:hypothetical protein
MVPRKARFSASNHGPNKNNNTDVQAELIHKPIALCSVMKVSYGWIAFIQDCVTSQWVLGKVNTEKGASSRNGSS